jgi:peptidoglycan/xylan/chitin deacetylase (PgdA/CDA1 family)
MTTRNIKLSLHRLLTVKRSHLAVVLLMMIFTLPLVVKTLTSQSDRLQQPIQLPTENVISDGTLRRIQVPILMYHYVGPLPENPDQYRVELTVSTQRFREHLEYLASQGYSSVSLYEVNSALLSGTPLPAKPIVLTFDDGYRDHYDNVLPLLREFNFNGTFFVITGYADQGLPQYLSWAQIQEMAQQGMSIEPHTKSHIDLRQRTRDELIYEIVGSVESIQAHTGQSGAIFAYPGGRYDDQTLSVLHDTSVRRAVTTEHGSLLTSDNLYELPRLRISGEMSVTALDQLLHSG